jgi:hypothetical protein
MQDPAERGIGEKALHSGFDARGIQCRGRTEVEGDAEGIEDSCIVGLSFVLRNDRRWHAEIGGLVLGQPGTAETDIAPVELEGEVGEPR